MPLLAFAELECQLEHVIGPDRPGGQAHRQWLVERQPVGPRLLSGARYAADHVPAVVADVERRAELEARARLEPGR